MSDTITITTAVPFKRWGVPNYAHIQNDDGDGYSIKVEQLPPAVLDRLAAEWLANLYASAGRGSPWSLNEPLP